MTVPLVGRNEEPWYALDQRPLGWVVRSQKFIDGPHEHDPPIGLFTEERHARLACAAHNALIPS